MRGQGVKRFIQSQIKCLHGSTYASRRLKQVNRVAMVNDATGAEEMNYFQRKRGVITGVGEQPRAPQREPTFQQP